MEPAEGKDFWSDSTSPEAIVVGARNGDALERWAAIFALGDIDQPWAIDELRRLAKDPEDLVSQAARAALRRLREEAPAPASTRRKFSWVLRQYTRRLADRSALSHATLVPRLKDSRPSVRAAAARALGEAGDVSALTVLCQVGLEDSEPVVRRASALALGVLEDSRASEALQDLLQDDDAGVRSAAATALGDIGDSEASEALCVALLDDDDAEVRASACLSLGACGARVADSAFSREREMVFVPYAIDAIEEALENDLDDDVRAVATEVLLQIEDERERLERRVYAGDEHRYEAERREGGRGHTGTPRKSGDGGAQDVDPSQPLGPRPIPPLSPEQDAAITRRRAQDRAEAERKRKGPSKT